jgi:hypothetical protein
MSVALQAGRKENLKLDESPSQIRNPNSQNGLPSSESGAIAVQFEISDFGFAIGFRLISKLCLALTRLD